MKESSEIKYTVESLKTIGKNLPIENSTFSEFLNILEGSASNTAAGVEEIQFEIVRILRNTSAKEVYQLEDENSFLKLFCEVAGRTYTDATDSPSDKKESFNRFFWQFLYNISTRNESLQLSIWKNENFKKLFFEILTQSTDPGLKNVLCGVAFNCARDRSGFLEELLEPEEKFAFVAANIKSVFEDCDFALLMVQALLSEENGTIIDCYDQLTEECKSVLLDIIAELGIKSSPQVISRLVLIFKNKSKSILTTCKTSSGPEPEAFETRKILSCLCSYSTNDIGDKGSRLHDDRSLLIDCVYLLRMIHELGKESNPNTWTPVRKLSEINKDTEESDNPVFGFKRDLIRLIGNLTYKSKQNQDLVRDIEGIQLLLDCSQIDGNNPFITQWVVLAIRNLCIDNKENQDIIRAMDAKGTVDKKLLAETGVDLH